MHETAFNYIAGDSLLHRLDPRTKLSGVMLLSILVFQEESFMGMALFTTFFLLLALGSKLSPGLLLRSVRPLALFILFIFCIQLFLTGGEGTHPLFSVSVIHPTKEGLKLGSLLALRFSLLLLYTALLTATTLPSQITNGIERLLRPLPLKFLGVSSFDLASMMALSIRFLPTFLENTNSIRAAQLSRGLDFRHSILKGITSLTVPLIRKSLRSAEEVAVAMESRCYQGEYRTSLYELKFQKLDLAAFAALTAFATFVILALRI